MARSLPDTIPLFPLPNVVHFPRVLLPLHVFEPRYRAMVRDALQGARLIGMVLLRGDWQAEYLGAPAVFEHGTAGEIVRSDELADGRFNIILRGVEKFAILGEETPAPGQLYRKAIVNPVAEATDAAERDQLAFERRRLETRLAPLFERAARRNGFSIRPRHLASRTVTDLRKVIALGSPTGEHRAAIEAAVRKAGAELSITRESAKALAEVEQLAALAVLVDMSALGAEHFCRKARSSERLRRVPIRKS